MRAGPWRRQSTKELKPLNCGAVEDSWSSLGQQGDQTKSILKEINPEYSLEGLMVKLKLQYFGHLMWAAESLEKFVTLGKIEGRKRRGCQKMRWLNGITDTLDMNFSKLQEMVRDREAWHAVVHGVVKSWAQLGNWTTLLYLKTQTIRTYCIAQGTILKIF